MVASQASKVFHCIRTLALHQHDGATDGNLLDLYVRQQDEAAFEALVRRHGRMVLGVCRRMLGNSHDAEDAFQATFLVLVRKAGSIRPAGMVGNWLYGVAQRTALEARRSAAKRRAKEAQVAPRTETPDDTLAHLRPLLDQELERLPAKYRAVLVLCDLEGRTRKEAAQQLGLPEGTIASRQARARTILAKRLTRQGVTLSGGALATALAQEVASAPIALVCATVRAATAYAAGPATATAVVSAHVAALTEGVLRTMLLSKLKIAVLLLVIGLAGTGWGNFRTLASDQPAVRGEQLVAQADVKLDVKPVNGNLMLSLEDLQGKWTGQKNGIKVDLTFHTEQGLWQKYMQAYMQAHWQVEFRVARKPEHPSQQPTMSYTKGADLSGVLADRKKTSLKLYLPMYLGDKQELKRNPSFNRIRAVAEVQKPAEGTLRLRIVPTGYEDGALKEYDYPAVEGLLLHRVAEPPQEGKKAPDVKKPADQDQAKQVLEMIRKGFQAYQDANDKEPADQDMANFLWDMMEKSYRPPDGKKAGPADQEALDQYKKAFLQAFQISSAMAKARRKEQAKTKAEVEARLDDYGPAFVQAYERTRTLKKALEAQQASDGKESKKTMEALDAFLKAGKAFEQAVKRHAKRQAVEHAKKEIENALSRVEHTAHDRRTELEVLDEIERAVQDMRKKLQGRKDGK
jgi:RNA polymerase sigma factor (sigma-70 family)